MPKLTLSSLENLTIQPVLKAKSQFALQDCCTAFNIWYIIETNGMLWNCGFGMQYKTLLLFTLFGHMQDRYNNTSNQNKLYNSNCQIPKHEKELCQTVLAKILCCTELTLIQYINYNKHVNTISHNLKSEICHHFFLITQWLLTNII